MVGERFSPWLKRQLVRREWSPADFARRLESSEGTVSHWLRGERVPRPSSCEHIADVLGVDRDLVLALAGHRSPDTELSPDDPVSEIISLVKRVDWSDPQRVDQARNMLETFIKYNPKAKGKSNGAT